MLIVGQENRTKAVQFKTIRVFVTENNKSVINVICLYTYPHTHIKTLAYLYVKYYYLENVMKNDY